MSTVYEAWDSRLGRAVALKVLPPEFLHDPKFAERFAQEARVVAALEHPNIVPIHASGVDEGIPWMSMRLLTGGTIGDLLADRRPEAGRIVELLRSVASALDYAHAHGIVHRDIKPTNVLLDGPDRACVGDFGLAYVLEVGSRMTQSGVVAGTPEYMAPEQALGKAVDHRCDIYSLAILAYEMFAGVPPFTGGSPVAVLLKHVNDPLPEPSDECVASPVMRVIQRGAAKEPGARWPSATAFVEALDLAVCTSVRTTATGSAHFFRRPARKRIRRMTSAGAAASLAAMTAAWLATREPRSNAVVASNAPAVLPSRDAVQSPPILSLPDVSAAVPLPAAKPSRPSIPNQWVPSLLSDAPISPSSFPPAAIPTAVKAVEPPPTPLHDDAGTTAASKSPPDIVTTPKRLRTVSPEYPQVARAAQLEGDVLLEATVTAEGKVTNVTVLRPVHPLLDDAARKAVLLYEYLPARRNDVPEAAVVRLTVSFRLR